MSTYSVTAKTVVVAQSGCEEAPCNVYQVPQRWCYLHCREKPSAPFSEQGQTEQVISQISLQNSPSAGERELERLVPSARRDQLFILNPADCGVLEISWLMSLIVLARARAKLSGGIGTTEFLCFKVVAKKEVKVGQRAGEGIRWACCSWAGQAGRESNCGEETALRSWTPKSWVGQ